MVASSRSMLGGPREAWGEYADQATVMPLDLEAEVLRWGSGASVS